MESIEEKGCKSLGLNFSKPDFCTPERLDIKPLMLNIFNMQYYICKVNMHSFTA